MLRATRSGAANGASESRGDAAVESGGDGHFRQKCIAWQDAAESVSSVLAGSGLDVGARMLDSGVGWRLPGETRGETCETCMLTRSRVRLSESSDVGACDNVRRSMGHVHVHAPMRSGHTGKSRAGERLSAP